VKTFIKLEVKIVEYGLATKGYEALLFQP